VTEGEVVLGGVGVGHVQHDLGPGRGLVDGRGPGGVAALQRLLGPAVQFDRSGLGGLAGVLVRGTVSSAVLCGRDGAAGGGQRHRDQGRNGQEQTASRHRGPSLVREFPLPPGNSWRCHRIPNISQEFWRETGTRPRPNSDSSSRRSRSLARNSRESTVPFGVPITSAASSQERPWSSTRVTATRYGSGGLGRSGEGG